MNCIFRMTIARYAASLCVCNEPQHPYLVLSSFTTWREDAEKTMLELDGTLSTAQPYSDPFYASLTHILNYTLTPPPYVTSHTPNKSSARETQGVFVAWQTDHRGRRWNEMIICPQLMKEG